MPLTAGDVMTTQLITVTPSTSLTEFARLCSEDNISGAPVTRVDGTRMGIVSKTDVIQRLLDTHPAHGTVDEPSFWDQDTLQVGDIMSEGFTSPFWIGLQVLMIAGLVLLAKLDWAKILKRANGMIDGDRD